MRGSHCQHAHVALYGGLSRSTCVVVQETPRQRHARINALIHRAVIRAEVPATKEPQSVSRDDGKRPDGLTLVPWQSGRSATWNSTQLNSTSCNGRRCEHLFVRISMKLIYTLNHKKRDILFLTITFANLNRFL